LFCLTMHTAWLAVYITIKDIYIAFWPVSVMFRIFFDLGDIVYIGQGQRFDTLLLKYFFEFTQWLLFVLWQIASSLGFSAQLRGWTTPHWKPEISQIARSVIEVRSLV
jgi:hypothetical protein